MQPALLYMIPSLFLLVSSQMANHKQILAEE